MDSDKIKHIIAKTILSSVKNDNYFGLSYNMNLYRGCLHGCIYCDSRSSCYRIDNFSEILVKQNALDLLDKELHSKRHRGTIGFGAMNDPYMATEKKLLKSRKALEIIAKHRYPVHIITKSNLVTRDIDLLKKISKVYAAVTITITTPFDDLARIIEPNAPLPSERFKAIKELNRCGIYTGVTIMPILPFINDTTKSIETLLNKTLEAKAKYVIPYFGVTLREGSREYLYAALDKKYPGIKERYIKTFGLSYNCNSPNADKLYKILDNWCTKHKIPQQMNFYNPKIETQLKLF